MSFWEFFWLVLSAFAFVAYVVAMFTIVVDLFRDKDVSDRQKAVWLVAPAEEFAALKAKALA